MSVFTSIILGASVLSVSTAVVVTNNALQASATGLMRREGDSEHSDGENVKDRLEAQRKDEDSEVPSNWLISNKLFLVLPQDENNCTAHHPDQYEVMDAAECFVLACNYILDRATGSGVTCPNPPPSDFDIDNTYSVQLGAMPHPNGCFIHNGSLRRNPTQAIWNQTEGGALQGQKVCVRHKYFTGDVGVEPSTACAGTTRTDGTKDILPVDTWEKCYNASHEAEGSVARTETLLGETLSDMWKTVQNQAQPDQTQRGKTWWLNLREMGMQVDWPKWCFKNATGFWSFNDKTTEDTPTQGKAICMNNPVAITDMVDAANLGTPSSSN